MFSPQDILAHANGVFGATQMSDAIGNTGTDGANAITGKFGIIVVHQASTLSDNTITNFTNLTGTPLQAGVYGGLHEVVELSGGDISVYHRPAL